MQRPSLTEANSIPKHTPGPWTTRNSVDGSGDIAIVASTKSIVAECFTAIRHSTERVEEECEANARLIAAAPDLFDAVKAALPVLEATQRLLAVEAAKAGMEPDDTLLNRMRSAVAKAVA
jgi:ATP-dependent helicase YprA (DUF1998 family)